MTKQPVEIPFDPLMPPDTSRSLPMALLRAREAVMSRFRPLLAARDLTEQQWRVIRVLGEDGRLDATELAARSCILAPSLTRILKALEERGYILRGRNDTDARRSMIEISPEGMRLIGEVAPESGAVHAELERLFGREKLDALLDILNELNDCASPPPS